MRVEWELTYDMFLIPNCNKLTTVIRQVKKLYYCRHLYIFSIPDPNLSSPREPTFQESTLHPHHPQKKVMF